MKASSFFAIKLEVGIPLINAAIVMSYNLLNCLNYSQFS